MVVKPTVDDVEFGHTEDGGPSWGIRGVVEYLDFVEALQEDDNYIDLNEEKRIGLPTAEDLSVETMVWDMDEPEQCFTLPDMQADLDLYLEQARTDEYEPEMSAPTTYTWVSWEAGWPHEHPASQNS